jgi:hypothetical protein
MLGHRPVSRRRRFWFWWTVILAAMVTGLIVLFSSVDKDAVNRRYGSVFETVAPPPDIRQPIFPKAPAIKPPGIQESAIQKRKGHLYETY